MNIPVVAPLEPEPDLPALGSAEPLYYTATLVVFIDAQTGAFLLGDAI